MHMKIGPLEMAKNSVQWLNLPTFTETKYMWTNPLNKTKQRAIVTHNVQEP